jgi:hypothetical protein
MVIILEPTIERNRPVGYAKSRIFDVDSEIEVRILRERAGREMQSCTHQKVEVVPRAFLRCCR